MICTRESWRALKRCDFENGSISSLTKGERSTGCRRGHEVSDEPDAQDDKMPSRFWKIVQRRQGKLSTFNVLLCRRSWLSILSTQPEGHPIMIEN